MGFWRRALDVLQARRGENVIARIIPSWRAADALPAKDNFEQINQQAYRRNAIVSACVREWASSISEASFVGCRINAAGEEEYLERTHPLSMLLARPNPEDSQYDFLERYITDFALFGNVFVHKARTGRGLVGELWRLSPDRIKIKPDAMGFVESYRYLTGDWQSVGISVPAADVSHLKNPDPLDEYWGLPFISAAYGAVDMDNQANDFLRAFFKNAGVPQGLLTLKVRANKEIRDSIAAQWQENYGGAQGWHSIAVLDADASYQTTGSSLKDMTLDSVFDQSETRICMAWGVPPILVAVRIGLLRSTDANYAQARRSLWEETLVPLYRKVAGRLTLDVAREFGEDLAVKPMLEDVEALQENRKERRDFAVVGYKEGLLTQNEARAYVDEEPVDDGDEFKVAAPAPNFSAPADPGASAAQSRGRRSGSLPRGEDILKLIEAISGQYSPNATWIAGPNALREARLARNEAHETLALAGNWRVLHRIADRAMRGVRRVFSEAVGELRGSATLRRLEEAISSGDPGRVMDEITWTEGREEFEREMGDRLLDTLNAAGTAIGQRGALRLAFDEDRPSSVAWANQHAATLVSGVTEQSRTAIREAVAKAFEDGGTPPAKLARQIRDLIGLTERDAGAVLNLRMSMLERGRPLDEIEGKAERYADRLLRRRSQNIARTETMSAANMGQHELWRQAEAEGLFDRATAKRVWLVTPDDRLDADCEEMDGAEVGLEEEFDTPIGPVLTPPLHPSCRCTVTLKT